MKSNEALPSPLDRQLALTRAAYTPSAALRERVLARLDVGEARPAAHATASAQKSPGLRSAASRVLAGASLIGLGFAAGWSANAMRAPLPPLPPTPQLAFDLSPIAPEPAPMPELDAPSALASARVPPAPAPRRAPAQGTTARDRSLGTATSPEAPTAGSTRDELVLLQRAERAIRADNSALALALIGELEESYPRSVLLEERRAIELMAHCAAGATDGAVRAERFKREHSRSVYAERIAELCRSGRAPAPRAR